MINCIDRNAGGVEYDPDTGKFLFYMIEDGYTKGYSYSLQDLSDCLSIAHAEKVKKDNEIRKKYENN